MTDSLMLSSRSSGRTGRLVALSILAPGGLNGPHPMEVNQRGSGFAARRVTANRPDESRLDPPCCARPAGGVPSGVQNGPRPSIVPWLPPGIEPSAGRVLVNAVEPGRPQQVKGV